MKVSFSLFWAMSLALGVAMWTAIIKLMLR